MVSQFLFSPKQNLLLTIALFCDELLVINMHISKETDDVFCEILVVVKIDPHFASNK